VEKAKAEWESALKNAAEKRAAITAPGEAPGPLESLEDILAKVKEAMAGLDFEGVAKRTVSVTGTFSAMAAGRRQIAKQGKELLKKAKPLVFEN